MNNRVGIKPEGGGLNALALIKGSEKYVILYTDEQSTEALRAIGRMASNPELSFGWREAAVLSQKIRRRTEGVPE